MKTNGEIRDIRNCGSKAVTAAEQTRYQSINNFIGCFSTLSFALMFALSSWRFNEQHTIDTFSLMVSMLVVTFIVGILSTLRRSTEK